MIIVYGENNIGISRSRMDKKKEKIPKKQKNKTKQQKNRGRDILEMDNWLNRRKRKKVRFLAID